MSATTPGIDTRLGVRIRSLRRDRGWTLDVLARAAGVSRAMMSRIERGESSPTAQMLVKVCRGLGVTLPGLFLESGEPATPLARLSEQATWRDPVTAYCRRAVSPRGTGSPISITEIEFPPGNHVAFDSLDLAGADQHVWVLDGALALTVGPDLYRLEAGDCLFMRFDRPVIFKNMTDRPVRYAVVVSHGAGRP